MPNQLANKLARLVIPLALLVPGLVLVAYAGLWPQGRWGDEYFAFYVYRLAGALGEWIRLWQWSPRPVSELLIFFYWQAVRAAGLPLVAPALAAAWAILGIGLLAAAQPWAKPGRAARGALVLTLPAIFLLGAPVSELFYWPFGALAYLPALAAASYATLVLAGPGLRDPANWIALSAVLSLGAASVEVGVFFALCTAPGLLVAASNGSGASRRLRITASLVPLLAALMLLMMLLHGRVAAGAEMFGSPARYHHIGLSLWLAAGQFTIEFLRPESGSIVASVCVKLLVFFGTQTCLALAWPAAPARGPILAVLIGLAATAFLSIAGAYYNFGTLCCERHAAYRQALFILMVIAAAGLWRPGRAGVWGPVLLALAVLVYLPPRIPALRTEYGLAHLRGAAWKAIFRSGRQPGAAPLDYPIAPNGPLFHYQIFPPGFYQLAQHPPSNATGPMLFFGKDSMRARVMTP